MFYIKTFLLLFLSINLYATTYLKSNYYITKDVVMLSDIVKTPKIDKELYEINQNRYSKRVRAQELLKILKNYGYSDYTSKHSYIQFTKKSPINLNKIKSKLKKYYKNKYKNIRIDSVVVLPMRYTNSLPKSYTVGFTNYSYLSRKGILFIKTDDDKKIFFNYNIAAKVEVYQTRKEINKGDELSNINIKKNSIMLDKFASMPLQEIPNTKYEAKHKLKKATIITKRDVTGLYLIKRGATVNVTLRNGGIIINFSARATQSGRYGDIISVEQNNKNKKIRVRVTGKNRAEVKWKK